MQFTRSDPQSPSRHTSAPRILLLTDDQRGSPGDWLLRWQEERENCAIVTLGRADGATRNVWVSTLAAAIDHSDQPVILVARGLACMAVTWWAALERPLYGDPVVGALLVTPPNVDIAHEDLRMVGFGPAPKLLMPFPSVVIASRNDPHMDFAGARLLSSFWGSQCIDGGHIGSADGYADLGAWSHGQHALDWLESNAGGMRQSPTKHANIFDIIPPRNHAAQGYDLSL